MAKWSPLSIANTNTKSYILDPSEKSHCLTFLNAIYIVYNASIRELDKRSKGIWALALAFPALLKTLIGKSP